MTNKLRTFEHESREANLLAAKKAVRCNRSARFMRRTDSGGEDIIDIVTGREIIERHICRSGNPFAAIRTGAQFRVEELALYQ